jgi:hypothetical protein
LSVCSPRSANANPAPVTRRGTVSPEDFTGAGQGADARRDVDRHTREVVASAVDVARVDPHADLEIDPIESRESPVP